MGKRALVVTLMFGAAVGILARGTPAAREERRIRLDHNRMLVEVEFQRKDGSWRRATAWVDTGNPQLALGEPLARDLGVEWTAGEPAANGAKVEASLPAGMRFGGIPIPLQDVSCAVFPGRTDPFPGVPAEANVPSTILRRFDVVFDYPGKKMILALPGHLRFEGTKVPCRVDARSGIVQVEVRVGGETCSFALDNGATYTLVGKDWLAGLRDRHPGWPFHVGLVGCANLWGMASEPQMPMMRFPEMSIGPVAVSGAGAAGLPEGLYEWYSKKTAAPVTGLLGPNVLKAFRVGIDFRGGAVYLHRARKDDAADMDLVGLTLGPQKDRTYVILGASGATGAKAGDQLLGVGSMEATGRSMGQVVDALRGRPGETRKLTVRRDGETLRLVAPIERQLPSQEIGSP